MRQKFVCTCFFFVICQAYSQPIVCLIEKVEENNKFSFFKNNIPQEDLLTEWLSNIEDCFRKTNILSIIYILSDSGETQRVRVISMNFQIRIVPLLIAFSLSVSFLNWSFSSSLPATSRMLAVEDSQPRIYLSPEAKIDWAINRNFTLDIWVENVSGLRAIYLELYWTGRYDNRVSGWFQIINSSKTEIITYTDILPEPYKSYKLFLTTSEKKSWIKFLCLLECDTPPQNGTAKIISIEFVELDPWEGGLQPQYIKDEHEWTPDNATSDIVIWWGYFLVEQQDALQYLYFGEFFGDEESVENRALFDNSKFVFMPIPGDLDGNGEVNAKDLDIITLFYNEGVSGHPNTYYDLNRDGVIDIYDIVIVAKNYGKTDPFG